CAYLSQRCGIGFVGHQNDIGRGVRGRREIVGMPRRVDTIDPDKNFSITESARLDRIDDLLARSHFGVWRNRILDIEYYAIGRQRLRLVQRPGVGTGHVQNTAARADGHSGGLPGKILSSMHPVRHSALRVANDKRGMIVWGLPSFFSIVRPCNFPSNLSMVIAPFLWVGCGTSRTAISASPKAGSRRRSWSLAVATRACHPKSFSMHGPVNCLSCAISAIWSRPIRLTVRSERSRPRWSSPCSRSR